ncbi:MAG TPA: hypothetical protein H9694_06195 [Firmicutes bacterium]|nr:hypothetical protein [Bacillota bacterium]
MSKGETDAMMPYADWRRRKAGAGRLLAFLFLAAVFLLALPPKAAAKTGEYEIRLDEAKENYVFSIQWENSGQQADVVITSPSGKSYNKDNMPQAEAGDGELMFWFASAEAGTWTVAITGEGLGTVTLDSGVMPGRMDIASFTVQVTGETGTASWDIRDSEEDLWIEIWAAPDPVNYGGQRLSSTRGEAAGQCEFSLSGLQSGDYYLYLKAIGSGGIFACQYADGPVSWRQADALPALDGVQARMLDEDLWLSWQESEDASEYRIWVYDGETGELLADETVEKGETQWFGEFPDSVTAMEAAVAAVRWGNTGDFERQTVTRGSFDGVTVTFPEEEQVNSRTVYVQVAFTGDYTVSAAINGEMVTEGSDTAGSYRVDMEEGNNRLSFYISDAMGNIRSFGKDLYVDVTAPQLSILKDLNGQSTSEGYVYLEGHTEGGASLTLNGDPVETQNGYFSVRCPLSPGKNRLELLATDAAGNQSKYSAVVERPWLSAQILLWVFCIAVAVVLIVVYVVLFLRARKKTRDGRKKK